MYGWCGTGDEHCGLGCLRYFGECNSTTTNPSSRSISYDGRCGSSNGKKCPENQCCSKYGWCGNGSNYCSTGCQSKYGICHISSSSSSSTSSGHIKVFNKCVKDNQWALTFDDGPYIYDELLLDYLKSINAKATFFVNGNNVMDITSEQGQKIIKRIYNEGHEIGSHTFNHADLEKLSVGEIEVQMTRLEDALKSIIGVKPAFVRPPYGSGFNNQFVLNTLEYLGYTGMIMWNIDTLDWKYSGDINYSLSQFKERLGESIISINHSFYQTISGEKLVELVKAEIEYMKSHNYNMVTMSECTGQKAYQ
ncbi:glycoside hydrolase/deacetylase [Piromyces finnis]|uniref:Glycoside hydrolase/deacetylase n=1 Tax=Piromyces finnis TaxID=1754191 RepID=A0A1Y1V0Z2_9FUNG|nr:glycoside hydrolase/deacetylase [Piromyces finnis]|eukprot:ORX44874.1 glycoside hydrolase/deacetylase [Piromyces finnis]